MQVLNFKVTQCLRPIRRKHSTETALNNSPGSSVQRSAKYKYRLHGSFGKSFVGMCVALDSRNLIILLDELM
jgi:hypothetical protein